MGPRTPLLALLLAAAPIAAQEQAPVPAPLPGAEEPEPATPPPPALAPADRGFTPSEKIKADSAVSFPVDI